MPPVGQRKSNLNTRSEFLIEGLNHAANLTKSAIIDHLPAEVQKVASTVKVSPVVHDVLKKTILRDHIYEYRPFKAETKPMTLHQIIESCERVFGGASANKVTKNTYFSCPVKKEGQTMSLETTVDHVVWKKPSASENYSLATPELLQKEIPSIAPLKFDASLFANKGDISLNYREYDDF